MQDLGVRLGLVLPLKTTILSTVASVCGRVLPGEDEKNIINYSS